MAETFRSNPGLADSPFSLDPHTNRLAEQTHAGYPLVSAYGEERGSAPASNEASRTTRVHTYGNKWRLAKDGYKMVSSRNL
jgi:hypothetical protein